MQYLFTLLFLSLISSVACGAEVSSNVYDPSSGELIGEVFTDDSSWRECTEEDQEAGLCEITHPTVCMTYGNDCPFPIICKLQVSASFEEPFTGFTKKVTDVRNEIVFYNSTHEVCFNFSKDVYNNWFLTEVDDPMIDCFPWKKQNSSASQSRDHSQSY